MQLFSTLQIQRHTKFKLFHVFRDDVCAFYANHTTSQLIVGLNLTVQVYILQ